MNKYEFISDFLESKRLDSLQKERLLKLVLNELRVDGNTQTEIESRLRQIEQKFNLASSPEKEIQPKHGLFPKFEKTSYSYIDPTELSRFLTAYNQHPLLKYTCHQIDMDGLNSINEECDTSVFNLQIYQVLIMDSFKELAKEYTIPKTIWALISAYLNGGKEWSSDKIKINWNSYEVKEWSKMHPEYLPNPGNDIIADQNNNPGFDFTPFRSRIFSRTIGSFSQLVIHFKSLFHIRADNSLKWMIQNINDDKSWNNSIDFRFGEFRENVEFFTDVDKLLQAYQKIIMIILEVSVIHDLEKPQVELILKEVDNTVIFAIRHINSTYKKTIKNSIERIGTLQDELINKLINGLCDLYIQADFGNNEYARINLWNGEVRNAQSLSFFEGVEYQLIFK